MTLEDIRFNLYNRNGKYIVPYELIKNINFDEGIVTIEDDEDGNEKDFDIDVFDILRDTEENDINGDSIYEDNCIHQVGTVVGCDIDFTGRVKLMEGAWWIDNGKDAVRLFNECCENNLVED